MYIIIRIFVWYLNYYKVCNIIYSSDKLPSTYIVFITIKFKTSALA